MVNDKLDSASAELIKLRAERDSLDQWRRDGMETITRLVSSNIALKAALERCVQVLELCDTIGEPHPTHDAVIAGLSKVCGAGPLMKALVNEWRGHLRLIHDLTSPSANHFTVGPTRDSVEGALRVGRAALGAQHDQRDDAGERPEAGDDRQGGFAPAGTGC